MQELKIININKNCVFISYFRDRLDYSFQDNINNINLENKFLCFIECPKLKKNINRYTEILYYKKYANENNLEFFLIYYNNLETITYKHRLKKFSDKLNDVYGIDYEHQIIFSSGLEDDFLKTVTNLYVFCQQKEHILNFPKIEKILHHFVFLNRIIKPHRIYGVVEIYERGINQFGNCSLGCGYYVSDDENTRCKQLIPEKYKSMVPLLIDEIVVGNSEIQYSGSGNLKIFGAMFNVVAETSFDYSVCNGYLEDQYTPMLTEKSMKPFAWGQIPIFISPKNNLSFLRNFGFDLFDDIIDHSYNSEEDGHKRIKMAIDQLEKVCQYDLDYWNKFKEENKNRFDKNFKISLELYEKYQEITNLAFNRAIFSIDTLN
jgi:hypothetical protein